MQAQCVLNHGISWTMLKYSREESQKQYESQQELAEWGKDEASLHEQRKRCRQTVTSLPEQFQVEPRDSPASGAIRQDLGRHRKQQVQQDAAPRSMVARVALDVRRAAHREGF